MRALLRLVGLVVLLGLVGQPTRAAARPIRAAGLELSSVERSPTISKRQAQRLIGQARQVFGVDFRLAWHSGSSRIDYLPDAPVLVPRGVIQSRRMTLDGLALVLAHEAAHAHGKRQERRADDWAARHGLARLWDQASLATPQLAKRGLRAAYSALRAMEPDQPLDVHRRARPLHINAAGYPIVQSRWDIYKAALEGRPMPRVGKRDREGTPEFLTPAAAARYLGVDVRSLARWASRPNGPVRINMADGQVRYVKDDLAQRRSSRHGTILRPR